MPLTAIIPAYSLEASKNFINGYLAKKNIQISKENKKEIKEITHYDKGKIFNHDDTDYSFDFLKHCQAFFIWTTYEQIKFQESTTHPDLSSNDIAAIALNHFQNNQKEVILRFINKLEKKAIVFDSTPISSQEMLALYFI